jgi:hypothetical protein
VNSGSSHERDRYCHRHGRSDCLAFIR